MSHRVVVTGMQGVTAFGNDWSAVSARLQQGQNAVRHMDGWSIRG